MKSPSHPRRQLDPFSALQGGANKPFGKALSLPRAVFLVPSTLPSRMKQPPDLRLAPPQVARLRPPHQHQRRIKSNVTLPRWKYLFGARTQDNLHASARLAKPRRSIVLAACK